MTSDRPQSSVMKAERSTFVDVTAWIFIVMAGLTTVISLMQNIMVQMVFKEDKFASAMESNSFDENTPALLNFMMRHFEAMFLLFFFVALLCFISAIGLLKRKNWARLIFIGVMALAIASQIGGLALQFSVFNATTDPARAPPADIRPFLQIMRIFTFVFAMALCGLFGFIIKKLTSETIRAEFS